MNLKYFVILMYVTLMAHQIEEYMYEFWKVFPLYDMSKDVFIIFNVAVSILLIPVWIYLWQNKLWAINIARAFSILMVVNGIWHIGWSIYLHQYMSGLITGIIFIVVFAFFILRYGRKIYSV
jgi:hypothetical protein